METQIYSVFPACGKTWIFQNQEKFGIKVLDSDSSEFSWCMRKRTEEEAKEFIKQAIAEGQPYAKLSDIERVHTEVLRLRNAEFPANYIEHIKEKMGTCDYIFVSSHEDVRSAMKESGIPYTLVYPDKKCLAEWVGRCYLREQKGTQGFPIKVLINNWYKWIDQCDNDDGAEDKIRLGAGEYLKDYLPEHELRS